MAGLIISLIGIALMAFVLYAGTNYISIDSYSKQLTETVLSTDFTTYNTLITSYKNTYNVYPQTASWESDLENMKGVLPRNNEGYYQYQYDETNYTVALCFEKEVSEAEYEAVKTEYSKGNKILSTSCFQTVDAVIDESSFPITIGLTQWIKE